MVFNDPEGYGYRVEVTDSVNHKLNLRAVPNKYGGIFTIYSDVLDEENAVPGISYLNVAYVDLITGARFDFDYILEILDRF